MAASKQQQSLSWPTASIMMVIQLRFGGLHKLFTTVRDFKKDFDVETVEKCHRINKGLVVRRGTFVVSDDIVVFIILTKVIDFLEGNGIGSNDWRCHISCFHQRPSALFVAFERYPETWLHARTLTQNVLETIPGSRLTYAIITQHVIEGIGGPYVRIFKE